MNWQVDFRNGTRARDPDDWGLAIFSSREGERQLLDNVRAALASARGGRRLVLDVLVNGNPALARSIRSRLATLDAARVNACVRLWQLDPGDKATAWNRYVHEIAPACALAFFVDGYVTLDRGCLLEMETALARRDDALAVTCMPSVGRSAAKLRRRLAREGGIHGNVYALPFDTMERLRQTNFRLPEGIYRTDPTLAAALGFNLDPALNPWRPDRIVIAWDALYRFPVLSLLKPGDLKTGVKRRLRQAQGILETMAVRQTFAIDRGPVSSLPRNVRDLVLQWAAANRGEAKALLWKDPLAYLMLARMRRSKPHSSAIGSAECLQQIGATSSRRAIDLQRERDPAAAAP